MNQIKSDEIVKKVEELRKMITEFIGEDIHILEEVDSPDLANYEEICNDINYAVVQFEEIRNEENIEE